MGSSRIVAAYYDRNTLPFLRFFGSGVGLGAIHREVWAPGVRTSEQAFEYVHHQVKAHCLPRKGNGATPHLLDLGCGVGGTGTWLAKNAGCRVTGVTLSAVQARLAVQRAETLDASGLCRFEVGDMTALSGTVSLEEYSAAYAIESLIHVADAHAFFRSACRVLQKGAPLLVCDDFLAPESEAQSSATREIECFREGWRAFGLRSAEQVKQAALEVGFELRVEQELTAYLHCVPAWVTEPASWLLRLPGLSGEYWGSLRGSTALQNCIRRRLTEYRLLVWSAPGASV
jgi:SAM-dependent methyltransferase